LTYQTSAEIYDPVLDTWTEVAPMSIGRILHSALLMPSGKVLVVGGAASGNISIATTELYDPAADSWTSVAPLSTARYVHSATLLPNGKVLVAGGYDGANILYSTEVYDPADGELGSWSYASNLNNNRYEHSAVLLANGKVLVSGGYNGEAMPTSELFDPSQAGMAGGSSMSTPRHYHTATLLGSGKVLAVGGGKGSAPATAELYDPQLAIWTYAAPPNFSHCYHTATLLTGGKVLIAGGTTTDGADTFVKTGELYSPRENSWMVVGSLNDARYHHTATLLANGRVLVTGGVAEDAYPIASAEIFDPGSGAWTYAAAMGTVRVDHTATLLPDGRVLVVGGSSASGYLSSAEVYDPQTDTWSPAASLGATRIFHTATLLPDGRVLVAGGRSSTGITDSVQIYDPTFNTWIDAAPMNNVRTNATATLLPSGSVLVSGGTGGDSSGNELNTAEVYDPIADRWVMAPPMISVHFLHATTLLASGKVLITGGWDGYGPVLFTDLFDPGLGFEQVWRPSIQPVFRAVENGKTLTLSGTGFRGYNLVDAAGGNTYTTPSNLPVVQIRRLDNEQLTWVSPQAFSATSYTSQVLAGLPAGPALVTVFVNGIPSEARVVQAHDLLPVYIPLVIR
jgi:N-acetylneuraminic acid mutarotase